MIEIVFATHNGASTLPTMLDALGQLIPPKRSFRIVAVDNCSTDDTVSILENAKERLPISVHACAIRGKNAALNSVLNRLNGDLVVFTDDDIVPDPRWLVELERAADEHQDRSIFGGRIRPIWPFPPPPWVLEAVPLGITYAVTPDEVESGPIDPGMIWGPNMMIRRHLLDVGHRFDETVGPGPNQYIMGSETEFNHRLAKAGAKTWFVNDAIVGHQISASQLQRQWIMWRAFRFGKNMRYQDRHDLNPSHHPAFLGLPRWRWAAPLAYGTAAVCQALVFRRRQSIARQWDAWFAAGYISQHMRMRNPAEKPAASLRF